LYLASVILSMILLPFVMLLHSERWRWVFWVVLGAVVVFGFTAGIALGMPDLVRHGYPSCSACHVSGAAGGGAVTAYGRSAGGEIMSTWGYKGEENPGLGLLALPTEISLGGDMRYLNLTRQSDDGTRSHVKFWMQADVEAAVEILPGVTVGGSYGQYGPEAKKEFRRNYVKLQRDALSLRAGRFTPAYGINFPDHTVPTRAALGLGQGGETYNAEASATGSAGEATLTGIYGPRAQVDASAGQGYSLANSGRSGTSLRLAAFVGDRSQVGLSALDLRGVDTYRRAFGGHAIFGMTKSLYALFELDRKFEDGTTVDVATARIGSEICRGMHLGVAGSVLGESLGAGAFLQWFPRPHWEVLVEGQRAYVADRYSDTAVLLLHYYL
jgi:hypothetical protein